MPDVEGYQLDSGMKVHVGTAFATADGSPATPQTVAHTNVIDASIDLESDANVADGFTVKPKVPSGPFQVRVDFDADLGSGVVTQSALFSGQIVGGIIAGLTFTPGVPEANV